jgi:hypothetical protein
LICPKPRSGVSPKQWNPARQCPPGAPETLTGSASQEGIRRLLRSQPRRFGFGQPPQARPRRGSPNIPRVVRPTAQNRNFLLCWKAELSILP